MGYTIYGRVDTLEEFEELQKRHSKPDIKDVMIKASKKANITKDKLTDVFWESGLTGVYNLGMKHMYEYEDKERDNRIEKIIEKLEMLKINFRENFHQGRRYLSESGTCKLLDELIKYVKNLK